MANTVLLIQALRGDGTAHAKAGDFQAPSNCQKHDSKCAPLRQRVSNPGRGVHSQTLLFDSQPAEVRDDLESCLYSSTSPSGGALRPGKEGANA